jgi:MFS transporter, MHS family, proline/betaine transporter
MLRNFFKKSIIPAVTIGSIIEWYEMGLYIYWSSVIKKIFYDYSLPISEIIDSIIVISVGLIARPLGGFIFGRFGDRKGRKKPLMLSIMLISIPTFLIGCTQSYAQWNLFATIFLGIMKFIQGIPAGGELPGAICYLAEDTTPEKKRYTCSYAFVGPQIGLLLSLAECLLLEEYLSNEVLMSWGWRISFLTSGILGIGGYLLRKRLHETQEYKLLKSKNKTIKNPIKEIFSLHKKRLILSFCVSIFEVVLFCLLTIIPVMYFKNTFNLTNKQNLIISTSTLIICAVLPPIIGKIANTYKKIPFLRISALSFIALSYPFYLSIAHKELTSTLIIQTILVLLFSTQVALLPSILSDLFPTRIRYTGIGFSFNICDGILWGLIPILGAIIIQKTEQVASFVILFPVAAIIFLISYYFVEKEISTKHLKLQL